MKTTHSKPTIKAVLFDLIGTTVVEKDGNVVNRSFEKAFADANVIFDQQVINNNRGKDKIEMINLVLEKQALPATLSLEIYNRFKANMKESMPQFTSREGALEIFNYLKQKKILIGIGTGMERELLTSIVDHLKWPPNIFDYQGIGPELENQRPHPDMILEFMKKMNIQDPSGVLKVGDTLADIQEGKNANVQTAVLLAGTQPEQILRAAEPDYILTNLDQLKSIT